LASPPSIPAAVSASWPISATARAATDRTSSSSGAGSFDGAGSRFQSNRSSRSTRRVGRSSCTGHPSAASDGASRRKRWRAPQERPSQPFKRHEIVRSSAGPAPILPRCVGSRASMRASLAPISGPSRCLPREGPEIPAMNAGGRRLQPQLARVATSDERQCFETNSVKSRAGPGLDRTSRRGGHRRRGGAVPPATEAIGRVATSAPAARRRRSAGTAPIRAAAQEVNAAASHRAPMALSAGRRNADRSGSRAARRRAAGSRSTSSFRADRRRAGSSLRRYEPRTHSSYSGRAVVLSSQQSSHLAGCR
jgi:hypothetical protein